MKIVGLISLGIVCLVSYLIGSGTNSIAMVASIVFFRVRSLCTSTLLSALSGNTPRPHRYSR